MNICYYSMWRACVQLCSQLYWHSVWKSLNKSHQAWHIFYFFCSFFKCLNFRSKNERSFYVQNETFLSEFQTLWTLRGRIQKRTWLGEDMWRVVSHLSLIEHYFSAKIVPVLHRQYIHPDIKWYSMKFHMPMGNLSSESQALWVMNTSQVNKIYVPRVAIFAA